MELENEFAECYRKILQRSNFTDNVEETDSTLAIRICRFRLLILFSRLLDIPILQTTYAKVIVPYNSASTTFKDIIAYVFDRVHYLLDFTENSYGIFEVKTSM